MRSRSKTRTRGFSILEMVAVIAIILILAAISVPAVNRAMSTARVRGAAVKYANLLQNARTRAINDDRFYSIYIQPAAGNVPRLAYIDVYPQVLNGTSGLGPPPTGHFNPGPPSDPVEELSWEITPQSAAAAPNTAGLKAGFCNTCATAQVKDSLVNPPSWGPDGMPCTALPSLDHTGTVCNSSGGPVAYVAYFQSSVSGQWSAVTLSPAGRVKAWMYMTSSGQWVPQ